MSTQLTDRDTMHVARKWWHRDPDSGKVVCTLCPRECKIPAGSRGFCFVRANVDDQLVLTTYGRSSGFCIDPIEKKPLNHFLPGTSVLSLGTAGCNLGCKFCQNWDISKSREMDTVQSYASPEAIVDAAEEHGCRSIAFTYNDPTIWAEYAIDIAKVARKRGIKTVAVTAAYISEEARGEFYEHMDAANVDLKAFTETFYRKLTQTHIEPVLDTIKWLKRHTDVWFELTTLVIPGENDSPEEIDQMCRWVRDEVGDDVPMHFSAFHPDFKMMDKPRTPHATLIRARQQALDAGIKYAYVGNVYDLANESTYCHNCGKVVIERDWYELGRYHIEPGDREGEGRCRYCHTTIPGVFDAAGAGDWGRKRLPIRIGGQAERAELTLGVSDEKVIGQTQAGEGDPPPSTNSTATAADPSSAPLRAGTTPASAQSSRVTDGRRPADGFVSAAATVETAPRIDFDAEQSAAIAAFAREAVNAAVLSRSLEAALPRDLADAPTWGLFVSLHRGKQLRGCRGRWAQTFDLRTLLTQVAQDTALNDERFPSIDPAELDHLTVEVSLMHDPQVIDATGDTRAQAVTVGEHGLVIAHPRGRGLLLPHVATEHGWDARQFLDQLCAKANLPADTWRRDRDAQLMTFRARLLTDAPTDADAELDAGRLTGAQWEALLEAANAILEGDDAATPADEMLARKHAGELGLSLVTSSGLSGFAAGAGHSLLDLVGIAARSLRNLCEQKRRGEFEPAVAVSLLWQPIVLKPYDYPRRHRLVARQAVIARGNGSWSVASPNPQRPDDTVGRALHSLNMTPQQWAAAPAPDERPARLTAFSVLTYRTPNPKSPNPITPKPKASEPWDLPTPTSACEDRPPARAGQFYPADPAAMRQAIDNHLAVAPPDTAQTPHRYRALMLPHAGWVYCGDTIGRTLARARLPDRVIILGPKHTPFGPSLSVASHQRWLIPGAAVPIDTPIADRLAQLVPGLAREPEAHRMEHGSEVLIPFLHRLNPNVRVTPMTLGRLGYDDTAALADALATILDEQPADDPVLLVISSDMNHFAPETENRRRDALALNAMRTGDPRRLHDVCRDNDISMCGVLPAVTVMQALLKSSSDLAMELVDYTTSAAVSGDTSRVVGYAGMVIE